MSSPESTRRSHLFVPGTDERLVPKALSSDADAVVLDLEDSIDQSRYREAHAILTAHARQIARRPTHLRVGMEGRNYRIADVELAVTLGLEAVRLPKAEDHAAVTAVADVLVSAGSGAAIHLTIESAFGLARLEELVGVSDRVSRLVFGERDFVADMEVDEPGPLTDHARAEIALVSRATGLISPLDGAYVDLEDFDGLRLACERARCLGFSGKSAVHPSQIPTIHDVFQPSVEAIERARAVVQGYEAAKRRGDASTVVDGRFVDAPVARRARAVLAIEEERHS